MKILIPVLAICAFAIACNKSVTALPEEINAMQVEDNEIVYTIEYTATGESETVTSENVTVWVSHNAYPVLSLENERDVILSINHQSPSEDNLISYFGFSFLFSLPDSLFITDMYESLVLQNAEDYPSLLFDDDPENGQRVCMTKHVDTQALYNACASEGWYGEGGSFVFAYTHHELYFNAENEPWLYLEGTFAAETEPTAAAVGTFKLSNGTFKVNTPLGQ